MASAAGVQQVTADDVGPGRTRIDTIFMNPTACQTLRSISYRYVESIGFDHVSLGASINLDEFANMAKVLKEPRRTRIPDLGDISVKEREAVYDKVKEPF